MHSISIAFVLFLLTISCRIGPSAQQICSVFQDQHLAGANLAEYNLKNASDCCEICKDIKDCLGYTWSDYRNGTCWLKSEVEPMEKKQGAVAGRLDKDAAAAATKDVLVSFTEFLNAANFTNYSDPTYAQYKSYLHGLPHGSISTKLEAAMALTHFIWESDGLIAKREYRCLDTGCPREYEVPGCDVDGQDYYGRGYIQLTWCYNYKPASLALFGDERLVQQPDIVAQDEGTAWNTAFWFWDKNVHSRRGVAEGKFGVTTKAINGGWECSGPKKNVARHRFEMYKMVRKAFGLEGDGDESGCYN